MKCFFCDREATCHLTKIVNGQSVEVHVCETCIPQIKEQNLIDFDIWEVVSKLAIAKGMPDPAKAVELAPPMAISAKSLMMSPQALVQDLLRCGVCGFTGEDLRKTGRLGCPECYRVFAEVLTEVLNDCQKSLTHLGKIPASMVKAQRQRLEQQLTEAVATERFEDAATLRDQLKAISAAD
ncbi:MAG: UvrB/UvrC motif-containing protein [Verrucomicrobiales bacterium]|jgi:protein arginine kinase activator|nr:UvrB/UvrC motif-containing protein [Verrucomicrobiales bacterium]